MQKVNNHDFLSPEHIASFLRNHHTGVDNLGRHKLASIVREYLNPTVLDVACGTAVNWEVFKSLNVQCQYTGLDRTKNMLAHAKSLYGDEIVLQEGSIQNIPFKDHSFGVVIARHIFEHLEEGYEAAIKEVCRVAAKEAILVFFLDLLNQDNDMLKESELDENGCTYWWNQYSHNKLFTFLSTLNCQIKTDYVVTTNAAHADTIIRIIK